jgi:hypothetical protein
VDLGTLRHRLFTGTPVATTLLAENFDTTAPGVAACGLELAARRRRERCPLGD